MFYLCLQVVATSNTMFEILRRWLYGIITWWCGIILRHVPRVEPLVLSVLIKKEPGNHKETDDDGCTLNLTKINGQLYAPFDASIIGSKSNLTIRDDDVMLCGFPKTGTHWVYEILYMLKNQRATLSKQGKDIGGMLDIMPHIILDSNPSPRVLSSHFLYDDLPVQVKEKKTKIVLTVRHPKDTVVSDYNHVKLLPQLYHYQGTFDNYFKMWMAGRVQYGCYFDHLLSWDDTIKNQTDNPIFVLEYEKLKKNPLTVVKEIARFLGVSIVDKLAEDIIQESSFKNMQQKRTKLVSGRLIRKG